MMPFKPGHPKSGGRIKGTPNKVAASLRAAILDAGEFVGAGGRFEKGRIISGEDGLRGYLSEMAVTRPELYMPLLRAVLPLEISGPGGGPIPVRAEGTLKDLSMAYAQMLRDGSYEMSDEERLELEGFVEENEIKLIEPPKPDPIPRKQGKRK